MVEGTVARPSLASGGESLTPPEPEPEHCWGQGSIESSCSPGTSQELGAQGPAQMADTTSAGKRNRVTLRALSRLCHLWQWCPAG